MIYIFIGPPFAGKDTQAKLLSKRLNIPVFSMGAIIREAYERKDQRAVLDFENYSMKGLHVPIELKFDLLKDKIDGLVDFMLDNFPANQEDIQALSKYLSERGLRVDKAFYLNISKEEMRNRLIHRGRADDNPVIVEKRREVQDQEREPVISYFRNLGVLEEIDGNRPIEEIHREIMERIK